MPRHTEALDLGLFTAPNPSVLQPGQLSFLQNGVYLPGSQALQRARGRAVFGSATAAATDVDGLRDIQFDNGDHYLVAMISGSAAGDGSYRIATVGDTGTFSNLVSGITAGGQLEVVHYRNRFFLMNGVAATATSDIGSNRVIYLSATAAGTTPTSRQHGMAPVINAPQVSVVASAFTQTVTGYYEYWVTEVGRFMQDGSELALESTYAARPATVLVGTTAEAPLIQRPPIRNAITTHWRIYRSPKKERESDAKFPSGFMIAEAGTATSQVVDSSVTANTGYVFASAVNTLTQVYADASAQATAWFSDNGTYGVLGPGAQGIYGFGFTAFGGAVRGIELEFQAFISSGTATAVTMGALIGAGRDGVNGSFGQIFQRPGNTSPGSGTVNDDKKAGKYAVITATASPGQTVTLGSSSDPWDPGRNIGLNFVDTDFDSNFMAVLHHGFAGHNISIDYAKLRAHYSGASDSVIQFPSVVYTFGDITAQVGKNGLPPSSSTGDLFEDCLVVNDVTNPAVIRYSAAGEPESFPETYFLDFETRDNDRVTNIKVVNNRLVVLLETACFRANYLPSERDSSFDRGKAIESISRQYGCVNEMCACTFSRDGGQELLAFVSDHGIHATDGYSFDTYTDGLVWTDIISRTSTSNGIALVNDRDRQELLFYYRNDAITNETYRCLHLSYASEHLVNGNPKVSGPVNVRNFLLAGSLRASLESAWSARRTSGAQDVFLGYGGTATAAGAGMVYRETGTTIPAQDDRLGYATRRMYLGGLGNEWRMQELYGLVGSYSGSPTISYTVNVAKTNDAGASALGAKSITLGGQALHRVPFNAMGEGMVVTAYVTASSFAQESLIIDGEGWGIEDSGR